MHANFATKLILDFPTNGEMQSKQYWGVFNIMAVNPLRLLEVQEERRRYAM